MNRTKIKGERYVKYESYIRTTGKLKDKVAELTLELERTQARNRNLRKAIKGMERAVNKLKAGALTGMLTKLANGIGGIEVVDVRDVA